MRVSVFFGLLFGLSVLSQGLAAKHKRAEGLTAKPPELQRRSDATTDLHFGNASIPSRTPDYLSTVYPEATVLQVSETRRPGVSTREPTGLKRHNGFNRKQKLILKREHRQPKRQCKSSSDSAAIGRAKTSGARRRLNVLGYQL